MHYDDVEWGDTIGEWRLDPDNAKKKGEQNGDDRRPAWTWVGYCYHDNESVAIPSANLTASLKRGGQLLPFGRNKNHKELAVSGIFFEDEYLKFFSNGKPLPIAPLHDLMEELNFKKHIEVVRRLGFDLSVKRATVGMSKHVRVRPRFNDWSVSGTLEVVAPEITPDALKSIFELAGRRSGLCDWRPGSPKSPGPYGMFDTKLKKVG